MMDSFFRYKKNFPDYEIHPQSETPHLTQIAHLDFNPARDPAAHLLPGTVIWFDFYVNRIVFLVWDFS